MGKKSNLTEVKLSEITFVKPSEMEEGDVIAGVYLDEVYGDYDTPTFHIETEDGTVGLNGTKQLVRLLSKVPKGAEVEIEYNGEQKLTKGRFKGKNFHNFSVRASETIGASASSSSSSRTAASKKKKEIED